MAAKNIEQAWEQVSVAIHEGLPPPYRILVADEDADILRLNTETLTEAGYDVDGASNGSVAWDAIQYGQYDLLVTENCLPKISGLELLKNIHIAEIELPVIMVTGLPPVERLRRPPWLQIAAILLKPYTADELLAVVKNVLYASAMAPDQIVLPASWQGRPPSTGDLRP
jgi:DNA-binding response OmpR family regulator